MKKIVSVLFLALALTLCACSSDEGEKSFESGDKSVSEEISTGAEESWAIYWYLCGSDLESQAAAATTDLDELTNVELPENVTFVIQTGGANEWQNELVDANALERYVYTASGLEQVDAVEVDNMGSSSVLADFMEYCTTNYPAERTMLLFWNHGGGSMSGAAFDEIYDNDSLTLPEMAGALATVYGYYPDPKPFDVVGFDTCLMATIDTAYVFSDYADYLVASEELEPGCGWAYDLWPAAFAAYPGISPADLGKVICDSFQEGCDMIDQGDEITLSVIDLNKVKDLVDMYNETGKEAIISALSNPSFIAEFERTAISAENYGGNTRNEGYTNMVDMAALISSARDLLPETSGALLNALDEAVVYNINGPYRDSNGLSCFFAYDFSEDSLEQYKAAASSLPFYYLYEYAVTGSIDDEGIEYLDEQFGEDEYEYEEIGTGVASQLEDWDVTVNEDGSAVMEIGSEAASLLQSVTFDLFYMDDEGEAIYCLGSDNNIQADWENGIFADNFYGQWAFFDGHIVYMELVEEGEDYNLYTVPILLNGEEYNLSVVYDNGGYSILGARKPIDDGKPDRNMVQLKPGDEITTIHYASAMDDNTNEIIEIYPETFTYSEDSSIYDDDMGDGIYIMCFTMTDYSGQSASSQMFAFVIEDGVISTVDKDNL